MSDFPFDLGLQPISAALRAPTRLRTRSLEAIERLTGAALLVASAPCIAVSGVLLAAISRRSIFVAHLRVGQHGQPLWILKLRTMWGPHVPQRAEDTWFERIFVERVVAEPDDDHKQACDPRVVSRFAAFCRRHSIDEFPQLWHVARGEMSLVGPRPLTRSELLRHYREHTPELLSAKPGLTGLWQTSGRSRVQFPERAAMDLALVHQMSVRKMAPALYLKILLRTLPALVCGKGAW